MTRRSEKVDVGLESQHLRDRGLQAADTFNQTLMGVREIQINKPAARLTAEVDPFYTAWRAQGSDYEDLEQYNRFAETGCAAIALNLLVDACSVPLDYLGDRVSVEDVARLLFDEADRAGLSAVVRESISEICEDLAIPGSGGALLFTRDGHDVNHVIGVISSEQRTPVSNRPRHYYVADAGETHYRDYDTEAELHLKPGIITVSGGALARAIGAPSEILGGISLIPPEKELEPADYLWNAFNKLWSVADTTVDMLSSP